MFELRNRKVALGAEWNRLRGRSLCNRLSRGIALSKSIETEEYQVDAEGRQVTMAPAGYYLYNDGPKYTIILASCDFENDYVDESAPRPYSLL